MENETDWNGKRVKIVLLTGRYYKGLVLSSGEDYIVIRDLRDAQVMIRFNSIETLEEFKE